MNTPINQLISFYNNKQQQQQQQQPTPPQPEEECYQIDLHQWLSLGQPLPTQPHTHNHSPAPRRSPPIPPRRPLKKTAHQQEPDNQHPPQTINQGCFRKAVQALWAVLIHQNSSLHHHHSYHDKLNQNVSLPGTLIRSVWIRSGLDLHTLAQIWDSADQQRTGALNFEQFLTATYQITKLRQARGLRPSTQPSSAERAKRAHSPARMATQIPAGRRTPPLVPASRSASVCSSASSASLRDPPPSFAHLPIPILDPHASPLFLSLQNSFAHKNLNPSA